MSAPDWRRVVEEYASRGPAQSAAVVIAREQARGLEGQDHWEAVYTLANQAVAMAGAKDEVK